jgi:ABC-type spermidine/putrescine transport system permease subunit I
MATAPPQAPSAPAAPPGPNAAANGAAMNGKAPTPAPTLRQRMRARTLQDRQESWSPRGFWASLAIPGAICLIVFFVLPFYVVLSVALGTLDPIFQSPIPVWNPGAWNGANFVHLYHEAGILWPPFARTVVYTIIASALSLAIAYPVAYFVTRYAGRRKTLFLILLISPFWVSYMMRMLAWIDLLQVTGFVNRALEWLHLMSSSHPVSWLAGHPGTVILGLVYGYIPYLIIVLYAGLDRIDGRLLEAARDLGLGRWRTFWRVTVPLSRQTVLAGMFITVLPMLGDYFTNQLLSATPSTTMIGNTIEGQLEIANLQGDGAAASVVLLVLLLLPMIYYVRSTAKASRENA